MAVIDNFRGIITVFVEFNTGPDAADELILKLKNLYEEKLKGYPGLISVNYHKSLEGHTVFNYSQWKTEDAFDAFLADKEVIKSMQQFKDLQSKYTKTKVVFAS